MLENLYFGEFKFNLRADEEIHLPEYKGSSIRGALGHALKKVVCMLKHQECRECPVRERCVYVYIFESPPPSSAESLRKLTNIPHPFIIVPPLEDPPSGGLYKAGEIISFGLILIGRALQYLPYVIFAFNEIGQGSGLGRGRGSFTVESVTSVSPSGEKTIYRDDDKKLDGQNERLDARVLIEGIKVSETLEMKFATPLRIKFESSYSKKLEFHIFFRTLLRRLSNLSTFHCDGREDIDFRALIALSEDIKTVESRLFWNDWERYSARQNVRMKLGGMIGKAVFTGNFEPFVTPIVLGAHLHAGKNTSFGLGKYEFRFL